MSDPTVASKTDNGPKKHQSLAEYLSDLDISYTILTPNSVDKSANHQGDLQGLLEIATALKLPLNSVLKGVLFKDEQGYLLTLIACDQLLDFPELCRSLNRDLEVVSLGLSPWADLYDKRLDSYPPVPGMLGVQGLLDLKAASNSTKVYIPSGHEGHLLAIARSDFEKLSQGIWKEVISTPLNELKLSPDQIGQDEIKKIGDQFTPRRMQERVQETFEMPVMPPMADELLKLRVDPTADVKDLARVVEKDPSLSAQLISWACSPYYGYPGKITCIDDAIIKVLGYDLVMNIALGIAVGQVMRVPNDGPLGLSNYWRHSIYNAVLIERLVGLVPRNVRPYRGLAYLCGLLHNFGFLLLGQVFPPQFYILNQMILINSRVSIPKIEHHLFNTDHQQLGGWLMTNWHMPEELVISMRWHHHAAYEGPHAIYAQLTFIANQLLAEKGVGDICGSLETRKECHELLKKMEISFDDAHEILTNMWEHRDGLDGLVRLLSNS